jgi:hypothetical protein
MNVGQLIVGVTLLVLLMPLSPTASRSVSFPLPSLDDGAALAARLLRVCIEHTPFNRLPIWTAGPAALVILQQQAVQSYMCMRA